MGKMIKTNKKNNSEVKMKEKPTYTIIGEDTVIQGSIKVKGSIMISGIVNGDIVAGDAVRISPGGKIKGNVKSS
jgi:cytoskeletal protein CcmA (bactofilin family)